MSQRVQPSRLPLSAPAPDDLQRQAWSYRTAPFSVLNGSFAVQVQDRALGAYLDRALAPLAGSVPPTVWWSVIDRGAQQSAGRERFCAYRGSAPLFACEDADHVAPLLLWWVNRMACFETDHRLMVHAAVASMDGRAVLLPAPEGSGKTTLVAGLVQDGYGYLTDEAAAIDPATGTVDAYPKWLSVESSSWHLFSQLRPALPPEEECFAALQWHVHPDAIRPGAVVASAEPAWIITPRYQAGAPTTLEPMGRAEALSILVTEAFNLERFGPAGFHTLAEVVRRSPCWRLTIGSLAEAVEAVRSVTG